LGHGKSPGGDSKKGGEYSLKSDRQTTVPRPRKTPQELPKAAIFDLFFRSQIKRSQPAAAPTGGQMASNVGTF
jgi:hypothetical protein